MDFNPKTTKKPQNAKKILTILCNSNSSFYIFVGSNINEKAINYLAEFFTEKSEVSLRKVLEMNQKTNF